MNVSSGKIVDVDCDSGEAVTTYKEAKALVSVSVTNKGQCAVVIEMRTPKGKSINRSTAAAKSPTIDRNGKGVGSVHLTWRGPGNCKFDYTILVS